MVLHGMKWPYWSVIGLPVHIQCYVYTYTNLNEILYTYIDVYILNHTHTQHTAQNHVPAKLWCILKSSCLLEDSLAIGLIL
jgi:hypothetical protein